VRVLGHRQTKGAATDKPNLLPPRHISTLPVGPFRSTEQLTFAQLFVIGDPTARIGARLPLRVLVTFEDPEMFPGCVPGVLASVEAINRGTRETQSILANPVITDIPARR